MKRVPCRHCRARIDQDWHRCPFCDGEDPIRTYRRRKRVGLGLLLALTAAAAVALPIFVL